MGQADALTLWPHVVVSADGAQRLAAEWGQLRVPERRDRPTGAQVDLAFVRIACCGERRGPPIIYLAGGPGSSAIASLRARLPWYRITRLVISPARRRRQLR